MAPGFIILFSNTSVLLQGKQLPCCTKATSCTGSILRYSSPRGCNSECYTAYLAAGTKFKGILRCKQMKLGGGPVCVCVYKK